MGRRLKGDLVWSGKVKASDFNRAFYNCNRGDYIGDGRSHNILTELVIYIDGKELKTDKSEKSVSGMVSTFYNEISNLDSDIGDKINGEIAKNLVRIDLIYNICCILKDSDWKDRIEFSFEVYGQKKENVNVNNNDDDESVSLNDYYFYQMIKHWIVSDHYNPTIRSEMIWDMLLSDFICDMMRKKYDEKGEGKEIIMLAKEFPYSNSEKLYRKQKEINLQGPKVDYLVGVEDILYFVELKTDLGSFTKSQYDNYRKYVEGSEPGFSVGDLWDRYKKIVKRAGSGKNYYEYTSTEKYRYQLDKMKKVCPKVDGKDDDNFIDKLKDNYKKIELTYITFDRIAELSDEEQIILRDGENDNLKVFKLENEDDDIKRQRWIMVMEIIKEVMKGEMPEPIEPEYDGRDELN